MNPGKMLHQPGGRLLALAVAAVVVIGMCVSMLGMAERLLQKDDRFFVLDARPEIGRALPLPTIGHVPSPPPAMQRT